MSSCRQIALFPIPNQVAFPGTVVPLHVFEPRYRRMINDAVEAQRFVGISHTKKEIRPAPRDQSIREALSSNQATYEPFEVFSAGPCAILQTTADGRIIAQVEIQDRFIVEQEVQTLPYRIVTASILEDEPETSGDYELQLDIHDSLLKLVQARNPDLVDQVRDEAWLALTPREYSFRIFQLLRFDPRTMQGILACTKPEKRLQEIYACISQAF